MKLVITVDMVVVVVATGAWMFESDPLMAVCWISPRIYALTLSCSVIDCNCHRVKRIVRKYLHSEWDSSNQQQNHCYQALHCIWLKWHGQKVILGNKNNYNKLMELETAHFNYQKHLKYSFSRLFFEMYAICLSSKLTPQTLVDSVLVQSNWFNRYKFDFIALHISSFVHPNTACPQKCTQALFAKYFRTHTVEAWDHAGWCCPGNNSNSQIL